MKQLKVMLGCIILGIAFIVIDQLIGNGFLEVFLKTQILPICSTILGFSVASVTFLIGKIAETENNTEYNFNKSRKEIKDSICFMIYTYVAIIFLLFLKPSSGYDCLVLSLNSLIMSLFFIQIYIVHEIINAIFLFKIFKDKRV